MRRALARGALVRGADGLINASLVGSAWRKPNRRTLAKALTEPGSTDTLGHAAHEVEKLRQAAKRIAESSPDLLTLPDAIAWKESYLALLRQLEYEQRSGRLIELAFAEDVVFQLFREQRNAWIRWLSKVAPFIAAAFDADVDEVAALLAEHVSQQLRELGELVPDFSEG
ncbi:hypothetical protein [Paraburkholderia nodosa]|uniref:hypothetical protein n=1 Tax=Paraburkholderia nodosa TaxID=392320 RepID=UPI0004BB3F79|nr:hypothetical protein [Paraburkholderia nodosa]